MRVLIINGAYRKNGATDQLTETVRRALEAQGAQTDTLLLRETEIGFCTNCRACMQHPGSTPGACVLSDAMRDIVRRIESSDAFVLASPTNAGSVTAIFKRLTERLVVYGYWPWGLPMPKYRQMPKKKAILIATCGAPGFLGRWLFSTRKELAATAKLIGARVCGTLFSGPHAQAPAVVLTPGQIKRADRLAHKLV